jgi:hypothetical protein
VYLTDIYSVFHLATVQYIVFSAAHRTFSKIDHILGNKVSLNKHKKTEITQYMRSDNGLKLELNNKRNNIKFSNTWRLNKFLNDHWFIEERRWGNPQHPLFIDITKGFSI